jgi:hypothetical protein
MKAMRTRKLIGTSVLALLLIAPSLAQAELRRVDLKIFGMD